MTGGATCAARLRRLSEQTRITIFEKGPFVSFANCGLPYFIGNIIEKEDSLLLAKPQLFKERFNIDVHVNHQVVGIDRAKKVVLKVVLVKSQGSGDVQHVSYDYLVLSPGAAPVKPVVAGMDLPGDLCTAVKSAVIIGGGFVGLEMAENLVHLGIKVSILQNTNQVMNPFDYEIVSPLHDVIKEHGVELRLGTTFTGFEQNGSKVKVLTKDSQSLEADIVILAIGVRPDVEIAKQAGLEIGSFGGIRTNEKMQTSDPSIYAVGDCIETKDFQTREWTNIPLAGPANRQGRIAADAIMGRDVAYKGVLGTAICKVFEGIVACTGLSEKMLIKKQIRYQKYYLFPNHHVGYYPGAEQIHMKILFDPENGKILGAQAFGTEGVDKRIDILAVAIQSGRTVHDLEDMELCYAPQFGAAKDPINLAGMIGSNYMKNEHPLCHWNDKEVVDLMNGNNNGILIDVRSNAEYEDGHAPNAVNIPLPELRLKLEGLSKDKPLYVYCRVGQRGYYATRLLLLNGFIVKNVSGGFLAYESSNK
ncbi:FAD/NAD-linked reductase, dimerization domain-containing protein [Rozella allomycis CSF55]|uniref:FAD/NAD-linked reductase, dimerization domain-containing protein n=1 Tax=Rozella allomycis (strain CSF55) TaxID=988480 RepID=A0A075AYI2_ROZAC|nr:FAD/NAD-linked reductase, dimerization domain-containing protein [Rozella allomycis CSF55]|eukprot:EPZ33777.1 FAD/NAD-linked reductase, dimerization domain-containing protein [Rozella allomycis CSF55]